MSVNPARAGMIPAHAYTRHAIARKPRASGDDPTMLVSDAFAVP